MAVVNFNSDVVADIVAVPPVKVDNAINGGTVKAFQATGEFAASDATSVGRMFRIRSSDYIRRFEFASDDLGTGGTVDVGLHDKDGGAAVDADFFKAAIDTDTAAVARTDVTFGNIVTLANLNSKVWELLGLSSDPNKEYDVTVTRNTAAGTGTVTVWGEVLRPE